MEFGCETSSHKVETNSHSGWTLTEDNALIESLRKMSDNGRLPLPLNENLIQIQTLLKSQLPSWITKSCESILVRSNWLITRFLAIREVVALGILDWDKYGMMLVGDEAQYNEWAKGRKGVRGLYRDPFPLYYSLENIYGKGMFDDDKFNVAMIVNDDWFDCPGSEEPTCDQPLSQGRSPRNNTKKVNGDWVDCPGIARNEKLTCDQPLSQGRSPRNNTKKVDGDLFAGSSIDVRTREPTSVQPHSQRIRSRGDMSDLSDFGRRVRPNVEVMSDNPATLEAHVAALNHKIAHLVLRIDALAGTKNDVADLQAKLVFELKSIKGLKDAQVFRAINILAPNHDLLRVFLTMSDEMKKPYILDLLMSGK